MQMVLTGSVDAAFISASGGDMPQIRETGTMADVSPDLYAPIRHAVTVLDGATKPTHDLVDFVRGPEGQTILSRHGFDVPA
jgi:ABC-type molybdate transport system substrate-binding protein